MKRIIFLGTIIISLVLFCCCDDRFNNRGIGIDDPAYQHDNEGPVLFWGADSIGPFYAFASDNIRHYLKNKKNRIKQICVDGDDVYVLTTYNTEDEQKFVLWKNGEMLYDNLKDVFSGCFFINAYNGVLRLYSLIPNEFNVYDYYPQYWENGNTYDIDLEMTTYSSMPLFSQPQGIIRAYGNTYFFGFEWCVNGKLPCIWKNGKIIVHADDTLKTNKPAAGFYIENDTDIVLVNYVSKYEPCTDILRYIPATYDKRGNIIHIYGDTAQYHHSQYRYCMQAKYIRKYNNDVYLGCEENNGAGDPSTVVVYKNEQEYFKKENCVFRGMTISNNNVYIAIINIKSTGNVVQIIKNGYPSITLENEDVFGIATLPKRFAEK
ncbi:MAG: hypothetical protein KIG42_04660 [Paludibacteraceae bacterium]|nr:hypothetical protein [Paludibacteraceae bacterium]